MSTSKLVDLHNEYKNLRKKIFQAHNQNHLEKVHTLYIELLVLLKELCDTARACGDYDLQRRASDFRPPSGYTAYTGFPAIIGSDREHDLLESIDIFLKINKKEKGTKEVPLDADGSIIHPKCVYCKKIFTTTDKRKKYCNKTCYASAKAKRHRDQKALRYINNRKRV